MDRVVKLTEIWHNSQYIILVVIGATFHSGSESTYIYRIANLMVYIETNTYHVHNGHIIMAYDFFSSYLF